MISFQNALFDTQKYLKEECIILCFYEFIITYKFSSHSRFYWYVLLLMLTLRVGDKKKMECKTSNEAIRFLLFPSLLFPSKRFNKMINSV